MFAVPGWSVSAASLKAEADPNSTQAGGAKKRKRPSSAGPANPAVSSETLADQWERVIEGKTGKKAKKGPKERKKEKLTQASKAGAESASAWDGTADAPHGAGESASGVAGKAKGEKEKKSKKGKKAKDHRGEEQEERGAEEVKQPKKSKSEEAAKPAKQSAAAPAAKLTPLQASMREKLVSARFRHLNETLYTKPSADAYELFEDSPEMFQQYHEGFRRQVDVWPENPVDGYIEDIKLRGRQKAPARDHHKGKHAPSSGAAPLLRTSGVCTIADLGCGDGKLAEALQSEKKKLKLNVLSYDLQSPSPLVTRADVANLPLADGSVNVAIFCLALMGTNWLDFIEEAYRILHWKGELWVAEIKSRFASVGKAKKGPVTHSVGNRKKQQGKKPKAQDEEPDESLETELAVEVDGVDDKRNETDVSAFVEALRKRGFVLQGAADLSNKMFVKMHFAKAAPAAVGKNVVPPKDSDRKGVKNNAVKFLDAEKQDSVDESRILKPCVYKLR